MIDKRILYPFLVGAVLTLSACPTPDENNTNNTNNTTCTKTCDDVAPRCDGDSSIKTTVTLDMTACECVSQETTTDCALDSKICTDGACVDDSPVCDPNPCTMPPEDKCEGTMFISWTDDPGTCSDNNGTAECAYTDSKTETDCAADNKICNPASGCVEDTTVTDPDPTCDNYCDTVMANCSGENAQYGDRNECMDYCTNVGKWDDGTKGATDGNTLACRIYHGNAPATMDPATHCVHAGPTGGNVCGTWCDNYCDLSFEHCTGGDSHGYSDTSDCQTKCGAFDATGQANDPTYDTVQCRIYHVGAPAAADAGTHCPHAGEVPTSQCVGSPADFLFDQTPADQYTRVDHMGMPAVSTALITSKAMYNTQAPVGTANFVPEIVTNLTGLHGALDDDLTGAGLTPCSMTTMVSGLPECLGQDVLPGVSVASLAVPDHLTLNTGTPAGFPNGRRLQDRVMDVTLAILLLKLDTNPFTTFLDLNGNMPGDQSLNPAANDKGVEGAFLTTFPYLHTPHTP